MSSAPYRPGRWLVYLMLTIGCLSVPWMALGEDDPWIELDGVVRGQSPLGTTPFASPPTFNRVTHTTVFPPLISQTQIAQAPADPFAVPPYGTPPDGGTPTYGAPILSDPGLGTPFLEMPAVWQPYVAAQGKAGTENASLFGQLMMPLYQDGQSLFFADIRGRFDDQSNSEGNFGLALRTMVDPTWFVGINAFYDHKRTEHGNSFNQGTVGIEAMSVKWEARMNGYIPESGAKAANDASTTEFNAGTIFVKGGLERAYYGLDGEIGALFWSDWAGSKEFRGFVGGYWFDTSDNSFPSVAGPKGRLEFRWYDLSWFGPQSRLTIGVEVQYDDVRDTQVAGLARLEIPLGVFPGTRRLTRLERRMLDRIVRDDDIITVTGQGPREVGIDSLTHRPLINVQHVTAGGDIATAIANAGVNGTVVVDGGAYTTAATFNVPSGQVLRGGGFQVIGSQTGATANFGSRPTITNTNAAVNTVNVVSNATVADLDLIGGLNGITAPASVTNVLISGNTVTDAAQAGYRFAGLLVTDSIIQNNVSRSSGTNGFQFDGIMNGIARGNTATGSETGDGYLFNILGPAAQVTGNTATNNNQSGFHVTALDLGGSVRGNTSTGNINGNGFQFDGAVLGTVTDNTATGNAAGDGFQFNSIVLGTVSGNTASGNGIDGFFFNLPVIGTVSNNTATNNADDGFDFASLIGTVSGNTASNNGDNGFEFNGLTFVGTFADNTANGNTNDGFQFNTFLAGTVAGNTANNNGGDGFQIFTLVVGGEVNGNTATANTGHGFNFTGFNPGGGPIATGLTTTVSGNSASNNSLSGFRFGGTVFGNVTDNKSDANTQFGYRFENGVALTSLISGNTATNNPTGGFFFTGLVNGNIDKNTAAGSTSNVATEGYGFDFTTATLGGLARVTENISSHNRAGFGFGATNLTTVINGNTASFNGITLSGTLFDATGNGFEWVAPFTNNAVVTNNFALGNANNGFSGTNDNTITHANAGANTFSGNLSNSNGDRGYIITLPNPAVTNNNGSGNVNGGDTAP